MILPTSMDFGSVNQTNDDDKFYVLLIESNGIVDVTERLFADTTYIQDHQNYMRSRAETVFGSLITSQAVSTRL